MSINKILPDDLEFFTLTTNPARFFSSSSLTGPTGSLRLFQRGSTIEKNVSPLSSFSGSMFTDSDISQFIRTIKMHTSLSLNVKNDTQNYMDAVNQQGASLRKQQTVEIIRFEPSVTFSTDTQRKSVVINSLMPYYRNVYPTAHFNYTNYHTLNFFTGSSVPADSVILYPNSASWYVPTGALSFDFWINARYKGEENKDFKAGTILHLSSCYAVSLVTGSLKDENGCPKGFRIQVQLSHSADVSPSLITSQSIYPKNLVFLTDDNSLTRNNWHHVTFRWGTNSYNLGSGSFVVDGVTQGRFVIPSASINAPATASVLCVGNYYEGTNSGTQNQSLFFTSAIAGKDGLATLINDSITDAPSAYTFAHPLNAEVHELKVYSKYLTDPAVSLLDTNGPSSLDSLLFYVPPFFTTESPYRRYNAQLGVGGIIVTPFFQENGTTTYPFNTGLSYGVNGHDINLENFTKDFARGVFPRLLRLTGSIIQGNSQNPVTANGYFYATGSFIKRNMTILPCDNGLFNPNFDFLKNGSPLIDLTSSVVYITGSTQNYVNDLGNYDYGSITLRDLASSKFMDGILYETGSIIDDLVGARPEKLSANPGSIRTILQRTRDNTSNEICFFDICNLYYGKNIKEKSLLLVDNALTGTSGKVKISLKDDGIGNVYRGDCLTPQATWNSVGNIFYNEGIVIVKSPHLAFFGTDQFDLSFKGEQDIHVVTFNLVAHSGQETSSSNPNYTPISASGNANSDDEKFVYIKDILIHDENLNVVMRSTLSQPIVKKTSDKYKFKIRHDW